MKYSSIKLMPDYHCVPLWHYDCEEIGEIDPIIMPISYELVKDLLDWAAEFDQTLDLENPLNSGFKNRDSEFKFSLKGYELAKRLKFELPNCEIVYFNFTQNKIELIELGY